MKLSISSLKEFSNFDEWIKTDDKPRFACSACSAFPIVVYENCNTSLAKGKRCVIALCEIHQNQLEHEKMLSQTDKFPKVGVSVIVRKDDKILMSKRKGSHGEGSWQFPGGHLEFGETVERCAKREVFEETNLLISNVKQINYTQDFFFDENKHYITLFVLADYLKGELITKEPNKSSEWQWVDSLPDNLFLPIQNLLKQGFEICN